MAIANADGSIILSTKVDTAGVKEGFQEVNKFAKMSINEQRSLAQSLSGVYRKQGLSQSEAQKKAWQELKNGTVAAKDYEEALKDVEDKTKSFGNQSQKSGKQAKGAFDGLKATLQSVAGHLALAFSVTKLISFSNESANLATQTEASVQRLVDIYGSASDSVGDFIDQNARALGMSKAAAASFSSVYGNLFSVWADQATNAELTNRYLNMTAVVASKTGRTVEDVQERVRSGLLGNTEAIEDLGIFVNVKTIEMTDAFKRMANGKSWEQLDAYTQQQIRSMAILEQATAKYGNEVAETSATTRARYQAAYQDFQNSWGNVVNTILLPVLETLTKIFDVVTAGLNSLSGKSGEILENSQGLTDNSADTTENIEEQVDAQKDLNKEMKKTLAGFDDIQILSENTAQSTSGGGGGLGNLDLGGNDPDGSGYVEEISNTLMSIMAVVEIALIAVGLILLFTGHIGWGIGFIIAGAATLGVTAAAASEYDYSGVIQMITTIMGIAGGALLALGIILLCIGGVVGKPVAIGMIIAGGALIVSAVATQAAFAPEDIAAWLSLIMGIAGGALLALGVILCMVGSISTGVGMIIAGSISLVSAVAMNSDAVVEAIKGPIGAVMAIVGAALLVIGIILVCTGVGIATGIALIAAGAVALVTPIAMNWGAIVEWVRNAWNAVKNFWNTYIAPVFTAEWWINLGKTCINGLIAGFEGGINGIIWAFESMINWVVDGLNKISFAIPDWVPGIGGQTWGINIPRASFGRVSIPRLAQGAVIPPNREFLAVLGDNKKENEIVSPVSTMKQAFMEAMIEMGGNFGGGNTEVVLEIDGREFGRAVVEQGNRENRRLGTRVVIA